VIPGLAQIEIRSLSPQVGEVRILPLRMTGPGRDLEPAPDVTRRSAAEPDLFTGTLWIMERGSLKVHVEVEGQNGPAQMEVPLAAVSVRSSGMQKPLGALLIVLGLLLVVGMIGIVGAAVRESGLDAGRQPDTGAIRGGRAGMVVAALILVAGLLSGRGWWRAEAAVNSELNYKVPEILVHLDGKNALQLELQNPNELELPRFGVGPSRMRLDNLLPDHGHLMHLFLVREPDMESFWHLHPQQESAGRFTQELPAIPAGKYLLYADIVHADGFPETQIATLNIPDTQGHSPAGDDAGAPQLALSSGGCELGDGLRLQWIRDTSDFNARQPYWFRFRVENAGGRPLLVLQDYMGMAGHAVFVSADGKIFAHVHPAGSVAMAAVALAQGPASHNMAAMDGGGNSEVAFPYGFPAGGDYRIFVQVRIAGRVRSCAFAARATNPAL